MKRYLILLFALAISLTSYGQNTEAQNLTLINVVRNNTLSPARVANALDALNYSKQGILQAYTASGTDTYAVTGPVAITAYASGQIVIVTFTNANTGASTLNINSTGAVALKDNEGNALASGALVAGGTYIFKHNGTDFWMVGASGGGGSGTVNSGTQYRIAHYATTGTAVSEASAITAARALKSDANGVPTHFDTSTEPSLTELTYVKGVTSALQTQMDAKAPLASPTFTGTPAAPTAAAGTTTTQVATTAFVMNIATSLYYNVKDYGAAGDGVTDDTAEITAAIAACPAGGTVYFPVGDYLTSSTITVSKAINLLGASKKYSRILTASTTLGVFTFAGTDFASILYTISVKDLRIENTNTSASNPTAGYGLNFEWCALITVDNVHMRGFYVDLRFQNTFLFNVDNCLIDNYVLAGIRVINNDVVVPMGDWGDSFISSTAVVAGERSSTYGLWQENSGGLKVTNCKFNGVQGGARNTYAYYYTGTETTGDLQFSNCSFENVTGQHMYITEGSVNIENVTITGCQFALGAGGGTPTIYVDGVDGLSISGCSFTSASVTNHLTVNDCSRVYIENSYRGQTGNAVNPTGTTYDVWNSTITAGGTTGNQTINKHLGSVNFAAAATSLTVSNTDVTASSIIICQVMTNDTTAKSCSVVPGSGTFTIYLNAAATAETKVAFIVFNNRNR
jgi:hypothetical protein